MDSRRRDVDWIRIRRRVHRFLRSMGVMVGDDHSVSLSSSSLFCFGWF